jgi:predicted dehydrogenase/acetyltransferase-like isoleucine patch superfamily enzyme
LTPPSSANAFLPSLGEERPRVAVVGCGYWGKNLVRNFHDLGALAALVDSDAGVATEFSTRFGSPALSWPEVLGNRQIDAVVIATPAATHASYCREALAAGKHIFVEKPLALNVAEAEDIVARAEKSGRTLMVGHLLQYHPAFLKLKQIVADGRLGRIQYIYSNRLNFGRIRREENVFWSFAPHDISMILALAGELPERIFAAGACYLHNTIADTTTTHLAFTSGINAHIFVSWLHPFKEQKLILVGDRGMATFDDGQPWPGKLVLFPHVIHWRSGLPEPEKAQAESVSLDEAEPLRVECQHFLACLTSGSRPRTDGMEGLRVLRVLDASERSMKSGRVTFLVDDRSRATSEQLTAQVARFAEVQVHPTAIVDDNCTIGVGTRIWHFSHVLSGSRIGAHCTIGQNVAIGPDVRIGDRCKIQNNVSLYKGVTLEDGVFCGPSCVFTNVLNPRAEVERKTEFRPTYIGRGATIGANATIVCGTRIGSYALVGAGAVVTSDVPDFALAVGVPARRIGWVSHAGERLERDLVCPREGRRYRQIGADRLEEIIESAPPALTADAAQ